MRILLIADGRSPTTRRWVQALHGLEYEVILVTTFPCAPVAGVEADVTMPVAFSSLGGSAAGSAAGPSSPARGLVKRARPLLMAARYWLGPLTLRYYGPRLRWLVERIEPDVVHALRIPFEGMLGAYTPRPFPLVISTWGNDLTLHACGSRRMAALTRRALQRTDALITDTQRDTRLARAWGLNPGAPALVVPGSGGLDLDEIAAVKEKARPGAALSGEPPPAGLFLPGQPLIVNPRGFRTGSVRTDTFFKAIPLILERRPDARFACPAMAGQPEAGGWVERLNLHGIVHLLPHLPQDQLWALLACADLTVSISQHDGTPNTLLEAMAIGTFPVAGDIESLREWITPGVNGLLVEPDNPQALAEAVVLALDNPGLRSRAAAKNAALVQERAQAARVRAELSLFYEALTASREIPE